jgi:hypothetical protein
METVQPSYGGFLDCQSWLKVKMYVKDKIALQPFIDYKSLLTFFL